MRRIHIVVALVLFVLLLIVNFSYAEENAIRIGGIIVKIGMSIDELKRILPAKYSLINVDEVLKKSGREVTKKPYATYTILDDKRIAAEVYVVKNSIVGINRTVGEYGGSEVMEVGDSIYSTIAAALENKSSGPALVEVKTIHVSKGSSNLSGDVITIKIGKRAIVIRTTRGTLNNKEVESVSVEEYISPIDWDKFESKAERGK